MFVHRLHQIDIGHLYTPVNLTQTTTSELRVLDLVAMVRTSTGNDK